MAVLVMCVGIVLIGSVSYVTMPREAFPDVKVPVVTVTTILDGANPTDVDTAARVQGAQPMRKACAPASNGPRSRTASA